MAYDGWLEFDGQELANLSRTAQLAEAFGVDSVWVSADQVQWIQDDLAGVGYADIANAPWYDAGAPESTEFMGLLPIAAPGLDDSTSASSTVEYIGDGGRSGRSRNGTLSIVFNAAIIALTERGAEFGKRWLDRRLTGNSSRPLCSGADLRYFRYAASGAPTAHRRDVKLTRGASVTRKRVSDCSSTWIVQFTLTADDSFEYGEPILALTSLGDETGATGPLVMDSGNLTMTEEPCVGVNYAPVYDPLSSALIPPPPPPDLLPAGWGITEGMTFDRFWVRVQSPEPSTLNVVPMLTLTTTTEARMVRVAIWPSDANFDERCDPLFSTVVSYLPAGALSQFIIDGEQKVAYLWDGASPVVRRADSLVYSTEAGPVEWVAFNDPNSLLVTLDLFSDSDGFEGGGDVRLAMSLVPKSD